MSWNKNLKTDREGIKPAKRKILREIQTEEAEEAIRDYLQGGQDDDDCSDTQSNRRRLNGDS